MFIISFLHIGFLHVSHAYFPRIHNSEKREENNREKGSGRKRDRFCHPVDRHDQDYESRPKLLPVSNGKKFQYIVMACNTSQF